MSMQSIIETKIAAAISPAHLQVDNESHNHNVPQGSESHFKVVVVSDAFQGKPLVARHQMVYGALAEEMKHGIHALALHVYTLEDWTRQHGAAPLSPPCLGGSKR